MALLSKVHKQDNLELYNFLKLSFINLRALHLNFDVYESFLKTSSPDILTLLTLWPLFMEGVQLPQGNNHLE